MIGGTTLPPSSVFEGLAFSEQVSTKIGEGLAFLQLEMCGNDNANKYLKDTSSKGHSI